MLLKNVSKYFNNKIVNREKKINLTFSFLIYYFEGTDNEKQIPILNYPLIYLIKNERKKQ